MPNFFNQEQLKELVSVTAETLGIRYPSILEKDYYVTQIINSLANIENEYFRLVFAGGTCLAKAHKIIKRMSEDVDFKIQFKNNEMSFSKNKMLKELKNFRLQIASALATSGLIVCNSVVRNEGQYSFSELTYPALFIENDMLRPHILIEFTLSDVRLLTHDLKINTIIEEVLGINTGELPLTINCSSIDETAVEKWVGLTRRVSAIERKYHSDDATLVRHIYDLNVINQAGRLKNIFFDLAKNVILYDAKQFKNQHPEYLIDPCTEIRRSLNILKNTKNWEDRYQNFIISMVYDKSVIVGYVQAISELEKISEKVIGSLEPVV